MCRTGICYFGYANWIFLFTTILFTLAEGVEKLDRGVQLVVQPQDVIVPPRAQAVLSCSATGDNVSLQWRFRDAPTHDPVPATQLPHRKQLTNGSLLIEAMSSAVAGYYQCVASADGVGTVVSRIAALILPELLPRDKDNAVQVVTGYIGGPVRLPCRIEAPSRAAIRVLGERRGRLNNIVGIPVMLVNVTWHRNGVAMSSGESGRVAMGAGGALEVDSLRTTDAGRYECRAALAHDTHAQVIETIELRVMSEMSTSETSPRFVATPQSATVLEGSSVTFDCAAVGNPKPEIIWLNNGVAIDLNDLDSRFYLVGSGSLHIESARVLDSGAYTCRAHNSLDSTDYGTQLHVLTPPRVWFKSQAVSAPSRGDVTLSCAVRGKPSPDITWLKDGDRITPNQHDITLVDGHDLRIQGVLEVDAGMFQCVALSVAGSSVATLRLHVDESPKQSKPHDIFSTLISSDTLRLTPDTQMTSADYDTDTDTDNDDLEESAAFTPEPITLNVDYFHAAKGLSDAITNASVVSAPPSLRAVLVKHRFVTLSWEPPQTALEPVRGYHVFYKLESSQRERVLQSASQRHEMNVPNLQPNNTYIFWIRAYTDSSISPASKSVEAVTPAEEYRVGAASNLRVQLAGAHALALTWRPPTPAPHEYRLYYTEVDSGREQYMEVPGAASSATLSTLRADTSYYIRLVGTAAAPSEQLEIRTPSDTPAAAPVNVTATPVSSDSILVRWDAPPLRTHRGVLTGYKLRYRPIVGAGAAGGGSAGTAGARRKPQSLTTPADVRRTEIRGLERGTTYQIRVCAINVNGSGPFSEWISTTTLLQSEQPDTDVPPKPQPLATRSGRDWITVSWSGWARGWELSWGLGVPDDNTRTLPASIHTYMIRDLQSNSEYVISLRASNALGLGPAVYGTVRTKPASEDDDLEDLEDLDEDEDEEEEEELPPLLPPVGLKVIMLSGTTAVVYWTDPTLPRGQTPTDGRQYVVKWSTDNRIRTFNATDLNCMIDDLKPFTTYVFAVKLIKGSRSSTWSLLVSNTTLESVPSSAPRNLQLSSPANARALMLQWTPPDKPNGHITGYIVMYSSPMVRGGEWAAVEVAGVQVTVTRLRPATEYTFKVQARNSKGLGPFSPTVTYATNEEGGLGGATGAWLWASAGGACAVLVLAAVLALSLCCRRQAPPSACHDATYHKAAVVKPPDLWIHHDQMELKQLDKGLHSSASKISAGSADGSHLLSSTLTLPREYERQPAPLPASLPSHASLDRRQPHPTYVDCRRSPSCSDDTAYSCSSGRYDYKPMSSIGCASTCDRRAPLPRPPFSHPDQSTPLLSGVASTPQIAPCGSSSCPLGASCGAAGTVGVVGNVGGVMAGDVYAVARERGHYVAYEPLGHYTHRESVGSSSGAAGSLPRRTPFTGMCSFADNSGHSTPSHGRGSVREGSPYKKSAASSPGHNTIQLAPGVLEPLTPSRSSESSERLHREMANLEGLMKDLTSITQHQFHC